MFTIHSYFFVLRNVFHSIAHFVTCLFAIWECGLGFSTPLTGMWLEKISPFSGLLFTWLAVPFAAQKLFSSMMSCFFIYVLITYIIKVLLRELLPGPCCQGERPAIFSSSLRLSGFVLKLLTYFQFIFCARWETRILFCSSSVNNRFPNNRYLIFNKSTH